jgi:hypothetical protein
MKRLQEATGKTSLNVGNYGGAVKSLTQDLRMMQQALAQMEAEGLRGSEAYDELAKKAGALKDNIADARAEISRYASDTRLLSDAMDIFSTASAAYQTYQGVVQAFGVESEEAMQAMAKLQGVISVTNGLQMLHAKFTDNASATYKVYHGILRLVGLEEKAVAASTIAATAAEQQQRPQQGLGIPCVAAGGQQWILRFALGDEGSSSQPASLGQAWLKKWKWRHRC